MPGCSVRPQFPHGPPYVISKGTFRSKSNQATTTQPGLPAVSVRPLLRRPGVHEGRRARWGAKARRGRVRPCGSNPREATGGEWPRPERTPPEAHSNPRFLPGGGGSGGKGWDSSALLAPRPRPRPRPSPSVPPGQFRSLSLPELLAVPPLPLGPAPPARLVPPPA